MPHHPSKPRRSARAATVIAALVLSSLRLDAAANPKPKPPLPPPPATLNQHADGYRGIWYMNQPTKDEYHYKYSGGLGTYCAHHAPFAIFSPQANKTFFCFGGTTTGSFTQLVHMVSCYDHATGTVPRPTLLLDKATDDAHDNPVISLDSSGHVWIFSTSHGTSRPSLIHRSAKPFDVSAFDRIDATWTWEGKQQPLNNFSYLQVWPAPAGGFDAFFTKYNAPTKRTTFFMSSADGIRWNEPVRLGAIHEGHYQVSAVADGRAACAFNYHPNIKGLNHRTNLYCLETTDGGRTWHNAAGLPVALPLTEPANPALVAELESQGLNEYVSDLVFDTAGRPVAFFLTSRGWDPGPKSEPRICHTAAWNGTEWEIRDAFPTDHNYDMGSLFIEKSPAGADLWRALVPTDPGPQPWGCGGEIVLWESRDRGASWSRIRAVTAKSPRNHNYVRRTVNAHPAFYALWADGDPFKPSESRLYFCDRDGNASILPAEMHADREAPRRLSD